MTLEKLPHNLYKVCSEAENYILITIPKEGGVEYAYQLDDVDTEHFSQMYFVIGLLRLLIEEQFDF